jgi:hypothetical protein
VTVTVTTPAALGPPGAFMAETAGATEEEVADADAARLGVSAGAWNVNVGEALLDEECLLDDWADDEAEVEVGTGAAGAGLELLDGWLAIDELDDWLEADAPDDSGAVAGPFEFEESKLSIVALPTIVCPSLAIWSGIAAKFRS